MPQQPTPVFILRRNAYRENSLLLDIFSREAGKLTCVAKLGRSRRGKGLLEPLRLLEASWTGRGEVYTLSQAEELRRYPLKQAALVRGVYLNEFLLRTLWQHQPQPELFDQYRHTLQALLNPTNTLAMPLFELDVLATAGYVLNLYHDDATGEPLEPQRRYRFRPELGLCPDEGETQGVPVSGALLIALRDPQQMQVRLQRELRYTLDYLIQTLLKGKTLNARKLFHE